MRRTGGRHRVPLPGVRLAQSVLGIVVVNDGRVTLFSGGRVGGVRQGFPLYKLAAVVDPADVSAGPSGKTHRVAVSVAGER